MYKHFETAVHGRRRKRTA